MYVFRYYVQQLSLTSKGLRQFTLAPLVISCSASSTSPSTLARYNDIFCDYRIKQNNHRTEISGYGTCITISSIDETSIKVHVLLELVANAGMYKQDSATKSQLIHQCIYVTMN